MALTRRELLLGVPALSAAFGCTPHGLRTSGSGYSEIASVPNAGARGRALVFMPDTRQTREVWTGLSDELSLDFALVAVKVERATESESIARAIARHRPSVIVLMNNPTVKAYAAYQRSIGDRRCPPAVIVMTSFLDGRPLGVRDATGISYEVPLISVVTNLRKVIAAPIERVGVIRREPLARFVARQAALAGREQIRVLEQAVSRHPNPSEVKCAIRLLKQRCDALWILNDDRLLSERLIADAWLPGLDERPWVPTIAGAASLVSSARSFGTLAVLPDHTALGVQAANLVYDIACAGFRLPKGAEVELPLSTTTIVDLTQVRERFSLKPEGLGQVDHVVE